MLVVHAAVFLQALIATPLPAEALHQFDQRMVVIQRARLVFLLLLSKVLCVEAEFLFGCFVEFLYVIVVGYNNVG